MQVFTGRSVIWMFDPRPSGTHASDGEQGMCQPCATVVTASIVPFWPWVFTNDSVPVTRVATKNCAVSVKGKRGDSQFLPFFCGGR